MKISHEMKKHIVQKNGNVSKIAENGNVLCKKFLKHCQKGQCFKHCQKRQCFLKQFSQTLPKRQYSNASREEIRESMEKIQ